MKVEWTEEGQTGEIEYGSTQPLMAATHLRALILQLGLLKNSANVDSFKVEYQTGTEYLYIFEQGVRKFEQIIDMDNPSDALMDFDCSKWRVSEFAPHRELRNQVLHLITAFQVTKIEVTWT